MYTYIYIYKYIDIFIYRERERERDKERERERERESHPTVSGAPLARAPWRRSVRRAPPLVVNTHIQVLLN